MSEQATVEWPSSPGSAAGGSASSSPLASTATGLRRFVGRTAAGSPPAARAQATADAPPDPCAPAGQPGGQQAAEHCEFCATPVPGEHGHVADLEGATLMCACRACYLLFTRSGAGLGRRAPETGTGRRTGHAQGGPGRGRYAAIPDRYLCDPGRPLSLAEWDSLQIPVGLAFFLRTTRGAGITAFYPSPAGATECQLNLEAWAQIAADHPLLTTAAPDVEAILISRGPLGQPGTNPPPESGSVPDQPGAEAFLVPIDACYELAGRMRLLWRGFDGGAEARQSIAAFLDRVRQRSRDLGERP